MTRRLAIAFLTIAAASLGCEDQTVPPPPSSTGGTTGTGNVAGMGPTGGAGGTAGAGASGGSGAMGGAGATGGSGATGGAGGTGGTGAMGGSSGAGGNAGGGGTSGAGGGVVAGSCDSESVNAIVALNPVSARQVAAGCATNATCDPLDGSAFLDCVSSCMETAVPGLTTSCGACYASFVQCLPENCLSACATNACDINDCENCTGYATCFQQLIACTGRQDSRDCFDNT